MFQQPKFKQHNIIALIAMVSFLLFMPLAKAVHLADHDVSIHEVHCKTCSSSALDDFDLPSPASDIAIIDYKSDVIVAVEAAFYGRFTKQYLSRAPPRNFL
ncbi:hypothetical protein [Thalassomonas sp. M1454]|uniref:hypothetical protein n=1 Tax=Thalassomonas sp. M1454 TaxID=2594477 RepID=UPI00117CD015|nr:hypothetical protein [Thalassomonas sp. M1454]TRX55877.1 hypothetical protein FNN08_09690 [Thalassomonas sp. M1454]